jgi:hypothetical protein
MRHDGGASSPVGRGTRWGAPLKRTVAAAVAVVALMAGLPTASGDEPVMVNWAALLPSWSNQYLPSSSNACVAGQVSCVDAIIREMYRRLDPLASSCDHNAVFQLAYLRITEAIRRAIDDPTFFDDPRYLAHEDGVFAKYYFDAYDDWAAERRSRVPPAWLIAFDAAAERKVSGAGNLLLGVSTHINRDLAFTLYNVGLTTLEGVTRKPDHDRVNEVINSVVDPILAEEAARFDPTIDDAATPLGLSYTALYELVILWRETAWRNAERLTNATTETERARVAQEIEEYAAEWARTIAFQTAYSPPLTSSSPRDAWCAENHG